MSKRKSQRVKESKDYSYCSTNEDDDFTSSPATNKRIKKDAGKVFCEAGDKKKNLKQPIVEYMKAGSRESVGDRLFKLDLQKALEISKNLSSPLKSTHQNCDITSSGSKSAPDILSDMPSLQPDNFESSSDQENIFPRDNFKPANNSSTDHVDLSSPDISNCKNPNGQTKSCLKDNSFSPPNKIVQTDSTANSRTKNIDSPMKKKVTNFSNCVSLNITTKRNDAGQSKHLSSLYGNLRLGLSRKGRIKSLHSNK